MNETYEGEFSNNVESERVEPIETVDDSVTLHTVVTVRRRFRFGSESVPFRKEEIDG